MIIKTTVKTNGSASDTGPLMHAMVRAYHMDMAPFASLTLPEIYDLIKNLPYRPDPVEQETLMRPRYTMNMQGTGGDCDDKAIALASWAVLNKIPYRFIAVRRGDRKSLHHVFPQLYITGKWVTTDPTYSFNALGREREHYVQRVII
jgi:transglutaminase-like putative cysteine protease